MSYNFWEVSWGLTWQSFFSFLRPQGPSPWLDSILWVSDYEKRRRRKKICVKEKCADYDALKVERRENKKAQKKNFIQVDLDNISRYFMSQDF